MFSKYHNISRLSIKNLRPIVERDSVESQNKNKVE